VIVADSSSSCWKRSPVVANPSFSFRKLLNHLKGQIEFGFVFGLMAPLIADAPGVADLFIGALGMTLFAESICKVERRRRVGSLNGVHYYQKYFM